MVKVKKISAMVMVVMCLLAFSVGNSFAATLTCPTMEIVKVGPTSAWFKNVTGSACGAVLDEKQVSLTFLETRSAVLLAIVLTASSLGKPVYVHAAGDVNGSIVNVVSMTN
jgi:hypothetical protein